MAELMAQQGGGMPGGMQGVSRVDVDAALMAGQPPAAAPWIPPEQAAVGGAQGAGMDQEQAAEQEAKR
jgi:hypothetical protein